MTVEQLRRAHETRPFRSFTLRTGGGRSYPISHPELLAIVPPGRTIIVAQADGSVEWLDLLLIESLHFNGANSRRSNGRRRS